MNHTNMTYKAVADTHRPFTAYNGHYTERTFTDGYEINVGDGYEYIKTKQQQIKATHWRTTAKEQT